MKKNPEAPYVGIEASQNTGFDLLQTYLPWNGGSNAGRLWYFRPWRTASAPPKESGVYAVYRRQYAGFAYYDTQTALWLMALSTVSGARGMAKSFHRELKKNRSHAIGVYASNYQENQSWSKADLAGIDEMPVWHLAYKELTANETAIQMCLLRQAMDPKLKRKQI
jgi:hypothetical protein